MFGSFGWMELLLILIIVLIIFGAGKLPQLGEGVGKAIKGFKRSVNEAGSADIQAQEDLSQKPPQPPPVEPSIGEPTTPPHSSSGPAPPGAKLS